METIACPNCRAEVRFPEDPATPARCPDCGITVGRGYRHLLALETRLKDRHPFDLGEGKPVRVERVTDYVPESISEGIKVGYAVFLATNGRKYVAYDTGRVIRY